MNIAFIWHWDKASTIKDKWRDGLRKAMEIIGKEHTVHWYLDKELPEDKYDALVLWDDSNSAFFKVLDTYHAKKALCLTTDPQNFENLRKLDAVYCESRPVLDQVRSQGLRGILAFGTDTDYFSPNASIKKDIEYFYPATFSPWKKQSEIAYLGSALYCVGTIQPDGIYELAECLRNGVKVEEGYFPVKHIRDLYRRSKRVIIPAIHGSERTVLEAMSCGIRPNVVEENIKAYSYIKEFDASGLSPRVFVLENYSARKYAADILRGIE
jgi:hypothetical protein